jgi:PKD repeat protein
MSGGSGSTEQGQPMRHRPLTRPRARRRFQSGQGLVELALVTPILLLLLLIAIDFGRVYLGWVNLQQMMRLAANYAADHATAWNPPGDPVEKARYQTLVMEDARRINCTPQAPIPDPQFPTGTAMGQQVHVQLSCQFSLITPVVSQILGGTILASADATYPIKEGIVATVPGGGAAVVLPPAADFVASPHSGWSPLQVTMTDISLNQPTSWTWDFSVSPTSTGAGVGSVSPGTSIVRGPQTVTYTCTGNPGDTCSFGVSMTAANAGGSDQEYKANWVVVTVPPATGPIADFTANRQSGTQPLSVTFTFNDLRAGTVTYTNYQWDFTNDGTFDATGPTASFTYSAPGLYDVRLRVTDSTGATNEVVKQGFIYVGRRICTVPDFATTKKNGAQSLWTSAGFTTTVLFGAGNGNYTIHSQTILGGTIDPQPNGCNSVITVGP